jgi:5'-3' exonuclease
MKIKRGIIDFSQICYAQFFGSVCRDEDLDNDEDKIHYFKHCVLNKLADIQSKLKFNETIIAIDSGSWRKKVFPYYKASRKDKRDEIKTKLLYACIDSLVEDIKQLNYKVIKFDRAEADDVIAILAHKFQSDEDTEKVYIVSTDKDFQQITSEKVLLYHHMQNEVISCENNQLFLVKQILSGDTSDGIPNVRSDDDTFINSSKRQTACGPKAIEKILTEGLEKHLINDSIFRKNYERNQRLITLSRQFIPEDVWDGVTVTYEQATASFKRKNSIEIGNYFRVKNLDGLISKLENF